MELKRLKEEKLAKEKAEADAAGNSLGSPIMNALPAVNVTPAPNIEVKSP